MCQPACSTGDITCEPARLKSWFVSVAVGVGVLLTLTPFESGAQAATLIATPNVTNNNAIPLNYSFIYTSPYVGGPYNALTANVGGTLHDPAGNGASLTGSFKAGINAPDPPIIT